MKKRKIIIGATTVIAFIIVMVLGIGGIKVVNANKINTSLELGIKYLTEGNYEEARLEFSKAISIDDKHEKATDLLALTEDYIELNELYANKEYLLVADLISKIKGNKYLEYIESRVNEISANTEVKIVIINEINNLDSQIQQLISENKFQEAIDLINKYLGEDLKQEYLDKLDELMNEVNESKTDYEEAQARLEAQRLAEEERKRQEEIEKNKLNDGSVYLIVEDIINENGIKYIDADKVEWVSVIDNMNGYRIDGIDNDINRYKLNDNCTFALDYGSYDENVNYNKFKEEIYKAKLSGFPPRARLCIAEVLKSEIIKISTVYTP